MSLLEAVSQGALVFLVHTSHHGGSYQVEAESTGFRQPSWGLHFTTGYTEIWRSEMASLRPRTNKR